MVRNHVPEIQNAQPSTGTERYGMILGGLFPQTFIQICHSLPGVISTRTRAVILSITCTCTADCQI